MQRLLPRLLTLAFLACAASACATGLSPDGLAGMAPDNGTGRWMMMVLIAGGTLVSEDLACIAAGLLAADGRMSPFDAVLASFVGLFIGDMLVFLLGRFLGTAVLNRAPMRWVVRPEAVESSKKLFKKRSAAIIFISRFTPGSRTATSFAAGALQQHPGRFALLFIAATAGWTPLIVLGTMQIGHGVLVFYGAYAKWALPCLVTAAVLLFVLMRIVIPLFTWRGRRLLLCRWRRLTRWEFWPMWASSGPVFFYVLYLGFLKLRKPTFFTTVNPGIPPDSGFIGESKDAIYRGLSGAGDVILPWVKIPASLPTDARLAALNDFLRERGIAYPIALKSDEGQRSLGVRLIHGEDDARDYLAAAPGDTIAQAYAPGAEFGVFYVRLPGDERGRILSIVEKRLTSVTGDGRSTLEELILNDDRAVCNAPVFLARFADRLANVPTAGERVELVDIGTHAQGALFIDGARYNTPELTAEIERISRCFEGFYLGRYDLRAPSADDLRHGRNLKIIELNGVTGQCSHIYSPGNSVFYAWRTIFAQWRIAVEIARRNEAAGCKRMPASAFLRHWRDTARRQNRIRECLRVMTSNAGKVPTNRTGIANVASGMHTFSVK